jgi:hypothetical protein
MRLHADALRPAEWVLAATALLFIVLALLLPVMHLPAGYHDVADQRTWFGIPHAMDVLSNLPFALIGFWGFVWLRRVPVGRIGATQRRLAGMFFAGLLLTTFSSSFYHWSPNNTGLCVDRLGMSLAFAGLLGLATADRISARAGMALAMLLLLAAPVAALWDDWTGNMTPWAVVQGGCLLLLAALALRRPLMGALGFSIGAVIIFYVLAKALESSDAWVFALTNGLFSGHSGKHIMAALAGWPVVRALQAAGMAPTAVP